MLTRALLILAYLVPQCFCKVYEDVAQLPGLSYDFVIVGGGTSGNVVANRLTENPKFSVLVLEAGVSNEGVTDSIVPFLVGDFLAQPFYDWNYTTVPQRGLNDRNIAIPRDGMVYTRASAEDYDRYASITGDPGWSWDRLLPYFFKNERWTEPADHHDTRGQFDPSVHSTKGINSVSLAGFAWPIFSQHIIEATQELPDEWPFNLDMNSGRPLGLGWLQSTIGDGKRSSSAASYLGPEFIHRENLHVLLHAQVTKLVDSRRVGDKFTFEGVQFSQAAKEIILSAGSVGTPNILMHSGIGDRVTLTGLGIPCLLDLPSVGRNASDQPLFGTGWFVNSNQTLELITQNTTRFTEAFAEWNQTHTGPFAVQGTTHIAWLRMDDHMLASNSFTDPSAGPNSPHIEVAFSPGSPLMVFSGSVHSMRAGMIVLNPISRGSVTINSTSPFDSPIIDVGFLQNDIDLFTMRQAVQKLLKFVKAPTWRDYIIGPILDLENLSDDALDEQIRNTASSAAHLVGTAAMSAIDARYGVVDPDLLVKGAKGLRIIDASVFLFTAKTLSQGDIMAVKELVETAINENKIMIFSKSTCPYCRRAKALFAQQFPEETPVVFELNEREDGPAIQAYLREKTGQNTVPNVFVNQKHVGGNDDTQAAFKAGTLVKLVNGVAA
ncbi:aryl-alcohol oxidase-like protein [Mycena capillaripes]|nr:aryl-alcohol oxidase-like protein [Mycena capillaripes]